MRERERERERERKSYYFNQPVIKINFFFLFLLSRTVHIYFQMCTVAVELKFLDLAPLLEHHFSNSVVKI